MLLLCAAALSAPASATLPTPAELRARPDAAAWRDVFKSLAPIAPSPDTSALPPPNAVDMGWDIQHYAFTLRIDPDAERVTGLATITAVPAPGGDLVLDVVGPEIAAVRVNGVPTEVAVVDDELHLVGITGDSVTVEVEWTAAGGDLAGIQWGPEVVYSFNEPSGARTWLPVYDHPWDKATLEWNVTAPDGWVVAANGVLVGSSAADPGWSTWRYAFDQPIPTYLMTVHLAAYTLSVTGTDIPVYTWSYGGREAASEATFANTPDMLDYFSALYAPYPWPSYGNALAPFAGAMENTTCVSFSGAIVGSPDAELVNVHELGHHWWGDDVTLGTWDDIWLNEGFATYTEALWYERTYGQEGLTAYAESLRDGYYEWRDLEGIGPLYAPAYMWGGTVYDKGGLVVHMLRGLLGDDAFFAALADYEADFHLGNATTDDFESTVEASTGQDLGWFFDEWVYGKGEPSYTWGWVAESDGAGGWQVDVTVRQDMADFTMPVPVRIAYADGTTEDRVVTVQGDETTASFCLPDRPAAVTLDPDLWVLRTDELEVDIPAGAPVCGQAPDDTPEEEKGCGCAGTGGPSGSGLAVATMSLLLLRRRAR